MKSIPKFETSIFRIGRSVCEMWEIRLIEIDPFRNGRGNFFLNDKR